MLFELFVSQVKASIEKYKRSRLGASFGAVVGAIIGIALGGYIVAYTLPSAIVAVTNETTWSGAPASVTTLGTLVLGIVIVVAVILVFIRMAVGHGGD